MAKQNSPLHQTDPVTAIEKDRLLILGVDGVPFNLLRPWLDQGHLPTLERIIREGVSGDLESVMPPLSATAWTSFATGKNPGRHGIVDFVFPRRNSYEISIASSETNGSKTFWDLLSENGRRVGIVSVPLTYPPRAVNGFMICSFMTPSVDSNYTYPAVLKKELFDEGVPFYPTLRETHRSSHVGKFLKELALSSKERVESVLYLLRKKKVDLFCFVFRSPDLIQHELWRIIDEQHPEHDPKEAEVYGKSILDFFVQLDNHIARIIEAMGEDASIILMSDHGFGPATHFFHVNEWLLEEGFIVLKKSAFTRIKYLLFKLGFTPINTFKILTSLKLGWLRQHVRFGRRYKTARRVYFSFNDIDWKKTRAFSVGNYGQIYINMRGVRPKGIVEYGAELEELKDIIIKRLIMITDPITGENIIQDVLSSEDLNPDDHQHHGPYLIPITRDMKYVSFGASDFGSNSTIEVIHGMSGYHRMEGMLVMCGKHFRSGITISDAKLVDMAPTILYALGFPIPKEMDGKVLENAFNDDFLASNELLYSDKSVSRASVPETYSDEEMEKLRERLRDLGYLA